MVALPHRTHLAVGLALWVSIVAAAQGPDSVGRFETFEVAVDNLREYADPYRDVSLRARFDSPAGGAVEVDGFFAGGRTWKARFRPSENGRWRYSLNFSDGTPAGAGTFEVRRPGQENPPLEIDPANPIWLRRGGRPFLMRALHVGDRFFAANWPPAQRTAFLDWLQRQGYNTLSVASHLLNRDEAGRGRGWATPRLWPLDAAAYDAMEAILDDLRRREIMVYPFAGFIGKNSNYPRTPEDQELYLRYTLARLGPYPNLVFNVAGPEPNLRDDWLPASVVERLGRRIRALDVYRHILTVHNETGPDPYRDSDWTTMGTLQGPKTLDRQKLARVVLENHHPAKPLFAQETLWSRNRFHMGRNGRDYSDDDLRKHLLVLNLSAAGVCFADNDGDSSSGFSGSLDPAAAWQARHDILKRTWDLFATFPYWQMKPRPDLVDNGWALATLGRQYLVYLDRPGTVSVGVEPGRYHYEWIDARDPARPRVSGLTADGRALTTPDGGDDWLLWLTTLPQAGAK